MILNDSIVLISSADTENHSFGSGFVIHQNKSSTYVLTCDHVIKNVGGPEKAVIGRYPTKLIVSGFDDGFDLAILRVEGLMDTLPLPLSALGHKGMPFTVTGCGTFEKKTGEFAIRPLQGTLGEQIDLVSKQRRTRVTAWDLMITDEFSMLKKGYSGSPVADANGFVFAVVSHGQIDGGKGQAIGISNT